MLLALLSCSRKFHSCLQHLTLWHPIAWYEVCQESSETRAVNILFAKNLQSTLTPFKVVPLLLNATLHAALPRCHAVLEGLFWDGPQFPCHGLLDGFYVRESDPLDDAFKPREQKKITWG